MVATHATYYTGSAGKLADGTRYRADGAFVAAKYLPLGTVIRVRTRSGATFLATVRDRSGRAGLDFPSRSFRRRFGRKGVRQGRLPVRFEIVRRPKHRHHRSHP